jgi:hypothetical protein
MVWMGHPRFSRSTKSTINSPEEIDRLFTMSLITLHLFNEWVEMIASEYARAHFQFHGQEDHWHSLRDKVSVFYWESE